MLLPQNIPKLQVPRAMLRYNDSHYIRNFRLHSGHNLPVCAGPGLLAPRHAQDLRQQHYLPLVLGWIQHPHRHLHLPDAHAPAGEAPTGHCPQDWDHDHVQPGSIRLRHEHRPHARDANQYNDQRYNLGLLRSPSVELYRSQLRHRLRLSPLPQTADQALVPASLLLAEGQKLPESPRRRDVRAEQLVQVRTPLKIQKCRTLAGWQSRRGSMD